MSQPRIKYTTGKEHRRAQAMLKGGRYATVTLVIDNDAVGKKAIVAVGLDRQKLSELFLQNADGRNLELVDEGIVI